MLGPNRLHKQLTDSTPCIQVVVHLCALQVSSVEDCKSGCDVDHKASRNRNVYGDLRSAQFAGQTGPELLLLLLAKDSPIS
jgi:hypothetical protein